MANIFVTGATGFVGSSVLDKLALQNHRISCLVRTSSNLQWIKKAPIHLVVGSLSEPQSYKDAVRDADYIFHIAGITKAINQEAYYTGNVVSTQKLLETVKSGGGSLKRFLLVSSQAAVGPSPSALPVDETFPCKPITDYGQSKFQGEEITKQFKKDLPITIIRPPSVFGPRDRDVYQFFKGIKKGINFKIGNLDQLISTVYIEDLAAGIVQAAFSENTVGETYFLCDEIPHFWSQVAKVTSEILDKKYITIRIPYKLALLVSFYFDILSKLQNKPFIISRQKMKEVAQPFWTLSVEKAKRDFGYRTNYPLKNALEKTVDWYYGMKWL